MAPGVTFALPGPRSSPPPRSLALQFGEIDIDSDLVSIREDLDPGSEQIMMLNNVSKKKERQVENVAHC